MMKKHNEKTVLRKVRQIFHRKYLIGPRQSVLVLNTLGSGLQQLGPSLDPHRNTITGRERLIRSHSSARFCFELSGNSN